MYIVRSVCFVSERWRAPYHFLLWWMCTLWWNCKISTGAFQGHQGNNKGAWSQPPLLPSWSIRHGLWVFSFFKWPVSSCVTLESEVASCYILESLRCPPVSLLAFDSSAQNVQKSPHLCRAVQRYIYELYALSCLDKAHSENPLLSEFLSCSSYRNSIKLGSGLK